MAVFATWRGVTSILARSALVMLLALPTATLADQSSSRLSPLIIGNDRGGTLRERVRQIREIERTGQRVKVVGNICYSTCTMFLGLAQTCVSPNTVFGFHGPSTYGRRLSPAVFDRASQIIADHYPAPLQSWYMQEARFEIRRLYRIRGSEMIRLGVSAC